MGLVHNILIDIEVVGSVVDMLVVFELQVVCTNILIDIVVVAIVGVHFSYFHNIKELYQVHL